MMTGSQKSTYVCVLNDEEARALRRALVERDFEFREVPYAEWGAFNKEIHLTLYKKGKLVVQGKGMSDFVQFFLEPEILKRVRFGYEAQFAVESGQSHIGVDESGKGDYFGPLVIAACYVEKGKLGKLVEVGVKDSKKLSTSAVDRLSKIIRSLCPHALVVIGPERYNQLYEKIKNLNRLLAWGHARSIENLLAKVDCESVVLDQFGNERLVLNALMKKGEKVKLKQMHRGEQDLAVAAASILARHEFLKRLDELGKAVGAELPRGAGSRVEELAKSLFETSGLEGLSKVTKLHFKITEKIVGERTV